MYMDMKEFLEYSKGRIIPIIMEYKGEKYPNTLGRPAFCYTTFGESAINITLCGTPLFRMTKMETDDKQ
ncbi:MAG: hypothetical protein ACO1OT_11675 [Heyndrickxia sp.]